MKKWVWIIFIVNLVSRLFLLNWNTAEYTDSIRWMNDLNWIHRVDLKRSVAEWGGVVYGGVGETLRGGGFKWVDGIRLVSSAGHTIRGGLVPPLYPAAILVLDMATGDREMAGKLISMLAAALTVFPLFYLGRRVYGRTAGFYAILLYTVSPLILRWSIRIMGEATYTLFMVASLWLFVEFFHSFRVKHLIGCCLFAAVAPLAHLPGRILAVPALFLFGYFVVRGFVNAFRSPSRGRALLKTLGVIALVLPVVFLVWALGELWYSNLARNVWYREQMVISLDSVYPRMERWIREYLLIFPYILTYPAAFFMALGIVRSFFPLLKKDIKKVWILLFFAYFVMIFAGIVINKWWTPRYLYALVPFSLVISAHGLEIFRVRLLRARLSHLLFAVCFIFSAGFTAYTLRVSRDSFGDLKRAALYVRDELPPGRVWTDEIVKTNWWAQRSLRGYTARNRHEVRPGDYVVLHSWGGTNIARELAYLRRRFGIRVVHEEKSWIKPILADDLLAQGANHPGVAAQRFKRQDFLTLIVQVLRQDGDDPVVSDGLTIYEGTLTNRAVSPGHNLQVWKIIPEEKESDEIVLRIAHAEAGEQGGFEMVAFADTTGDGWPDTLLDRSPFFQVREAGSWSAWTFSTPEKVVFVGNTWYEPAVVYYDGGIWPYESLDTTMFYSNTGSTPTLKVPSKITNLLVSFGNEPERRK